MRRYLTDCPEILEKLKPRNQQHLLITSCDDLIARHPAFMIIADEIKKICRCTLYAYGSRVNGNYKANSDYDVAIMCDEKHRRRIKANKFDFKVDLHFINKRGNNMIEL